MDIVWGHLCHAPDVFPNSLRCGEGRKFLSDLRAPARSKGFPAFCIVADGRARDGGEFFGSGRSDHRTDHGAHPSPVRRADHRADVAALPPPRGKAPFQDDAVSGALRRCPLRLDVHISDGSPQVHCVRPAECGFGVLGFSGPRQAEPNLAFRPAGTASAHLGLIPPRG